MWQPVFVCVTISNIAQTFHQRFKITFLASADNRPRKRWLHFGEGPYSRETLTFENPLWSKIHVCTHAHTQTWVLSPNIIIKLYLSIYNPMRSAHFIRRVTRTLRHTIKYTISKMQWEGKWAADKPVSGKGPGCVPPGCYQWWPQQIGSTVGPAWQGRGEPEGTSPGSDGPDEKGREHSKGIINLRTTTQKYKDKKMTKKIKNTDLFQHTPFIENFKIFGSWNTNFKILTNASNSNI